MVHPIIRHCKRKSCLAKKIFGVYHNTMKRKPQRGRPPLPAGEAAHARIQLKLTEAEKADYLRAAARAGVTLSEWMKDRLGKAARRECK